MYRQTLGQPSVTESRLSFECERRTLTDDELAELERLTSAATPGPWTANIEDEAPIGGDSMIGLDGLPGDYPPDMYVFHDRQIAPSADIKFIAAARNYMPRLIAELRRLGGHS